MNRATTTVRTIAPLAAALALLLAAVMPVGAGQLTCSLQATVGGGSATEVEVGEEVLIEGFDFPPGDVEVTYSLDGMPGGTETVTADASGLFETTVTPVPGEEGLWTVTATDVGDQCTAETGFLVVGAPATPPPPTPAPPLPDVAVAAAEGGPGAEILGMLFVLAAALLIARPRLARRVR
jgi:hypothetical protein